MRPLRILILEDQPVEAKRMVSLLRQVGFTPDWDCVDNETDYLAHVEGGYDLILAKDILPDFDARTALRRLRSRDMRKPPLIVIADPTCQETAVDCVKLGAADYVVRDRMLRLGQAVNRALEQHRLQEDIRRLEQALHSSRGFASKTGPDGNDQEPVQESYLEELENRLDAQSIALSQAYSRVSVEMAKREKAEQALQATLLGELETGTEEQTAQQEYYQRQLEQEIVERKQAEEDLRDLLLKREQALETLERRVGDRTRDLIVLSEITAIASEFLSMPVMLARCLEKALTAVNCNAGAIHLLSRQHTNLGLVAHQGIPSLFEDQIQNLPLKNNLWGQVLETDTPLAASEPVRGQFVPQEVREQGLDVFVAVPIHARGTALGVLSIFGKTLHKLTVEEVELLSTVADQIGIALESTRLRRWAEETAVIEERHRLARELHDSVTQSLYSLALYADGGRAYAQAGELARVEEYMNEVADIAQQTLKEMRLLVYELRPAALEQEGLVGALRRRLEAVEQRTGISVDLALDQSVELPPDVEAGLYRIAQEALNNVLKHAAASQVKVVLCADSQCVKLQVADNGHGFDPEGDATYGGMGLGIMRERAISLGGAFQVSSSPGEGSQVQVTLLEP